MWVRKFRSEALSTNRELNKLPVVAGHTDRPVVTRLVNNRMPVTTTRTTTRVVKTDPDTRPPPPPEEQEVVTATPDQTPEADGNNGQTTPEETAAEPATCVFPAEFMRRLQDIEDSVKTNQTNTVETSATTNSDTDMKKLKKKIKKADKKAKEAKKKAKKLEKKVFKAKIREQIRYLPRSNVTEATSCSYDGPGKKNRNVRDKAEESRESDEDVSLSDEEENYVAGKVLELSRRGRRTVVEVESSSISEEEEQKAKKNDRSSIQCGIISISSGEMAIAENTATTNPQEEEGNPTPAAVVSAPGEEDDEEENIAPVANLAAASKKIQQEVTSACSLPISREEMKDYVKTTARPVVYYGYMPSYGRDTKIVAYNTDTNVASQYTLRFMEVTEPVDINDKKAGMETNEYFGVTARDVLCPGMGCYSPGMVLDVFTEYDLLKKRKECFSCATDKCVLDIVLKRFDQEVSKLLEEYNSYQTFYNSIRLYMFAIMKSGIVQDDKVFVEVFLKGVATRIIKYEEPNWHLVNCCDDAPELAAEWYDQAIVLLSWTRTLLTKINGS